jgi:hypothetical protein
MSDTVTMYYPNRGSPTTTLVINGPIGGQAVEPFARFVTGQSVNGKRYVYQKNAVTQNIWVLQCNDMTAAQKASLTTFFQDTVKGPTSTFDYTHTDATQYNSIRFADTDLQFTRVDTEYFNVQVRLELPVNVDT